MFSKKQKFKTKIYHLKKPKILFQNYNLHCAIIEYNENMCNLQLKMMF